MKTTAKPTPGPWCASSYEVEARNNTLICNMSGWRTPDASKANAELIAEAGTVYHETGLSPRQLLDQRNALWDALENIKSYPIARPHPDGPSITRDHMAEIQAAIAKVMSEGRNAEPEAPRFPNVSCSQCGQTFGPGDHGFSHCENHAGMKGER